MPICKKCNQPFPNKILVNGKEKYLNSRSYCLICSPIGEKMGYDLRKKTTDEKYKTILTTDKKLVCLICQREFAISKKRRKNNKVCSTCRSNYLRHKTKEKAAKKLGGKCIKCGENDIEVLQFHHKNPEEKDFALSANWGIKNWKLLEKEVDKCELLCSNCHIKLHRKNIQEIINFYERKRK